MAAKKETRKTEVVTPEAIEALRRAMILYDLVAKHVASGGRVILQDATGYQKELVVK